MLLYFSTSLQHLSFFLLLPCLALLGGVPLGILQWRVIKQVNHSHWWIIVTIADILLSLSLLQFWHIEIEVFTLNPFPVGFPYGLLTGLGMITFLRGGLEQAQKWGGKNSPKEASKG